MSRARKENRLSRRLAKSRIYHSPPLTNPLLTKFVRKKFFDLGHFSFNRNKTQTAVTNICLNCITFINLTFRMLQHSSSEVIGQDSWILSSFFFLRVMDTQSINTQNKELGQ